MSIRHFQYVGSTIYGAEPISTLWGVESTLHFGVMYTIYQEMSSFHFYCENEPI